MPLSMSGRSPDLGGEDGCRRHSVQVIVPPLSSRMNRARERRSRSSRSAVPEPQRGIDCSTTALASSCSPTLWRRSHRDRAIVVEDDQRIRGLQGPSYRSLASAWRRSAPSSTKVGVALRIDQVVGRPMDDRDQPVDVELATDERFQLSLLRLEDVARRHGTAHQRPPKIRA